MICPKCNIEMIKGIALKPLFEVGCRHIAPRNITYMLDKPEIIECLKCPKCGYSDDMH